MTVFVVLPKAHSPDLERRLKNAFTPDNIYKINDVQWLVSAELTARQVTEKIDLLADHTLPSTVVFSINNYFGRHNSDLWEWIKLKMEAKT